MGVLASGDVGGTFLFQHGTEQLSWYKCLFKGGNHVH